MPSSKNEIFRGVISAEKYQSTNPISKYLVSNFTSKIISLAKESGLHDAHEIGCGEGQICGLLANSGFKVRGCDISEESLAVARLEAGRHGLEIPFKRQSIYDLNFDNDAADLVLCCEVLEHLPDPELALKNLVSITKKNLIVSVPREPIWHLMNMARGRYWSALGNTPGHFNHWTTGQFVNFVRKYIHVDKVLTPLPWTIVSGRPRR